MNKQFIVSCCFVLSLVFAPMGYAKEPKNLETIKLSLIKYHDSGEYLKDQAKVTGLAMEYLKTRIERAKNSHDHKMAVVFDIDDTTLSNYPAMLALNFGGTLAEINEHIEQGVDPAITPTLELYRYALANNVAIFFITGRKEHERDVTEKNLKDVGYSGWSGLLMRPEDYTGKSIVPFKSNARAEIEHQGYDIVLSIGDQASDLMGGYLDKGFKLPNPYYLLP